MTASAPESDPQPAPIRLSVRLAEGAAAGLILAGLAWWWPTTVTELAARTIFSVEGLLALVMHGMILWGCVAPLGVLAGSAYVVTQAFRLGHVPWSVGVYVLGTLLGFVGLFSRTPVYDRLVCYSLLIMVMGTFLLPVESRVRAVPRVSGGLWLAAAGCCVLFYFFLMALEVGKSV
jgi:hypothetical protein